MDSAPSAPATPDPYQIADAQAQSNVQTAIANSALGNANVYSPLGSSTYQQTGSTTITGPLGEKITVPTYTNNVTLSPQEQKLFDQQSSNAATQNQVAGNLLSNVGSTLSSAPNLQTSYDQGGTIQHGYDQGGAIQMSLGNTDFSADRDAATNAVMARLQPSMDRDNSSLQSQLTNQGVTQGSAAYNSAMQQLASNQNDLKLGAVQTGDAEQQALFNEAATAGQFANSAQAQQNQENAAAAAFNNEAQAQGYSQSAANAAFANQATMASRDASLNELGALSSGGQVTMPQFASYQGGQVAQTPVSSDVYNSAGLAEQQYQAQMGYAGQENAGLFGLGGSLLGTLGKGLFSSDRRLKTDIERIGTARNGLPVYSYRYLWGGRVQVGYMADEVRRVRPEAVYVGPGGFDLIDFAAASA